MCLESLKILKDTDGIFKLSRHISICKVTRKMYRNEISKVNFRWSK